MSEAAQGQVDVLLFRVGKTRYGADASQVARIDRAKYDAKLAQALDTPGSGSRSLVFNGPDGKEQAFFVDEVDGVRRVDIQDLRRVPAAAGKVRGILGLLLEGDSAIVLIDLQTIL